MRILTQQSYDAICDIVMEQKKRLEEKEKEIERLNKQISFLENLINMKVDVTIHDECLDRSQAYYDLKFGD